MDTLTKQVFIDLNRVEQPLESAVTLIQENLIMDQEYKLFSGTTLTTFTDEKKSILARIYSHQGNNFCADIECEQEDWGIHLMRYSERSARRVVAKPYTPSNIKIKLPLRLNF